MPPGPVGVGPASPPAPPAPPPGEDDDVEALPPTTPAGPGPGCADVVDTVDCCTVLAQPAASIAAATASGARDRRVVMTGRPRGGSGASRHPARPRPAPRRRCHPRHLRT